MDGSIYIAEHDVKTHELPPIWLICGLVGRSACIPTHPPRTHARIGARCRGGRNGWDGHTRPNHGAAAWWWWRRGVARTRATRPRLLGHTTTHSGARARARVTETDSRPGRPVARCTVARAPARDAEEKTPHPIRARARDGDEFAARKRAADSGGAAAVYVWFLRGASTARERDDADRPSRRRRQAPGRQQRS